MAQMQEKIHQKMEEQGQKEEVKDTVTEDVTQEVTTAVTEEVKPKETKVEQAEQKEEIKAEVEETKSESVEDAEDSSLKTQVTEQEDVTKVNVEKPQPTVAWDETARNEGWVSPQELEAKVQEYKDMTEKPTDNDLINKLVELSRSGKRIDIGYIARQMIDYNNYDVTNEQNAKDLIKQSMKTSNPDMTDEEIAFEMRMKYKDLQRFSDDQESEEYRDALERLQFDAQKAKRELMKVQKEESLPSPDAGLENQRKQQEKQQQEFLQFWSSEVPKQTKGKDTYSVQLKEGAVDYELSPVEIKRVNKFLKENLTHASEYFDAKTGTWDWEGMWNGAIMKDKDIMGQVIQKAVDQASAKGKEDLSKEIKNTNTKPTTKPAAEENSENQKVKDSITQMYKRLGVNV